MASLYTDSSFQPLSCASEVADAGASGGAWERKAFPSRVLFGSERV